VEKDFQDQDENKSSSHIGGKGKPLTGFQRTWMVLVFVNTMSFIPLGIYNQKALLGYNLVEELPKIQNASSI
jgi:hypothetical protein